MQSSWLDHQVALKSPENAGVFNKKYCLVRNKYARHLLLVILKRQWLTMLVEVTHVEWGDVHQSKMVRTYFPPFKTNLISLGIAKKKPYYIISMNELFGAVHLPHAFHSLFFRPFKENHSTSKIWAVSKQITILPVAAFYWEKNGAAGVLFSTSRKLKAFNPKK